MAMRCIYFLVAPRVEIQKFSESIVDQGVVIAIKNLILTHKEYSLISTWDCHN